MFIKLQSILKLLNILVVCLNEKEILKKVTQEKIKKIQFFSEVCK